MGGWEEVTVRCLAELERVAGEYRRLGRGVFVLFSGDKDPASGTSWCPDCVDAEPILRAELPQLPEGSVFIYCLVGNRDQWLNPENEFRKKQHLTEIPTLLKFGTPLRLTGYECSKADLVHMLFTEE